MAQSARGGGGDDPARVVERDGVRAMENKKDSGVAVLQCTVATRGTIYALALGMLLLTAVAGWSSERDALTGEPTGGDIYGASSAGSWVLVLTFVSVPLACLCGTAWCLCLPGADDTARNAGLTAFLATAVSALVCYIIIVITRAVAALSSVNGMSACFNCTEVRGAWGYYLALSTVLMLALLEIISIGYVIIFARSKLNAHERLVSAGSREEALLQLRGEEAAQPPLPPGYESGVSAARAVSTIVTVASGMAAGGAQRNVDMRHRGADAGTAPPPHLIASTLSALFGSGAAAYDDGGGRPGSTAGDRRYPARIV